MASRQATVRPVGPTRSIEPGKGKAVGHHGRGRTTVQAVTRGPSDSPGPRTESLRAELSGFHQVPPVFTRGTGSFRATVSETGDAIEYELTYSDLSAPTTAAHIHFGHPTDNGGIIAFLCGGDDAPACPEQGGTVRGTITAEHIQAIPEQGLAAGDMAAALQIIRDGLAYVNVHTTAFPDGEIRGQLQVRRER